MYSRGQTTLVQPVSQVEIELQPRSGEDVLDGARRIALRWLGRRAGRRLPDEAWRGEGFDLADIGAQRCEAVALDAPRVWAARLDDADREVARRIWATEIGLGGRDDGAVMMGVRLQCVTHGDRAPFDPSVPRLVRDITREYTGLVDRWPVRDTPWMIDTPERVSRLVALLKDPARRGDVIVFSLPEGSEDPENTAANAAAVARQVAGAAHVTILTGPASFALSDRVGREFSVYRGAVRTYRPGFDPERDQVTDHPLGLPHHIAAWAGDGPSSYERLLVANALRRSVTYRDIKDRVPPFSEIRRLARQRRVEAARATGTSDRELLRLYEDEMEKLREDLEGVRSESDSLLEEAEQERDAALEEAEQTRATNAHLRRRIESLRQQLEEQGAQDAPEIPDTLDPETVREWCERHMAGDVELHTRANQGLKRARFEDPELVFRSLLVLRDIYVPMRRGEGDLRRSDFDTACQELGVEEAPTFSSADWGRQGDEYLVRYQGRRCLLDRHMKKGNARDERHCFRLYFFWDERDDKVVVGWLPSHLDTRAT